jgi:BolA protein
MLSLLSQSRRHIAKRLLKVRTAVAMIATLRQYNTPSAERVTHAPCARFAGFSRREAVYPHNKIMTDKRITSIKTKLETAFSPKNLTLIDESHLHRGHAGAKTGKGHYRLKIEAESFKMMPVIQRHRAVYKALGKLMDSDIHALSIEAIAPDE